uniref:Receptor for retinol uptake STRA6 n=1 Tax=Myripristis murdjan TaxID=586833 RepID=A0A668AU36_9TELE
MLILAVLTRKNRLCQGFTRGSSSILSPVNFLDQTQNKGLAIAVFGLLFSKLAVLVIAPDPLPFSKNTPEIKEYMKIIAIFYYPVLYYPLLVCGTLQNKAGYAFGSLLSLSHFGVLLWQKFECPKTTEIYKYYSLLASLPQLASLAYLCVQFPLLFIKGPKSDEDLDSSYYTDYVKSLLKRKSSSVALLLVVLVIPPLHIVQAGIDKNIAFLLSGFQIHLSDDNMEVVRIVTFYTWLLEVCFLCAVTLSCLVSVVMLMRSMILHRSNLKGLYRGDIYSVFNCQKMIRPSKPGIVCWMGLAGYQTAIICLGMVIQTIVFLICFMFLVFLILVPIFHGRNLILFQIAAKAWPVWVSLILVTALQHVTAKFAFIKKDAGTRDLNNRGSLFLLTYLLFLINIVLGLIVAIWRMVITALYNILHLGRIDISLLHRTSESYDPAYRYYAHSLKVEVSQSHPVMKAFCGLLLDILVQSGSAARSSVLSGIQMVQQEKKQNKAANSRRIRSRWQLLFTLVNNPSLLGSRKHFQLQTSDSLLNGTMNRNNKEAGKPAAEAAQPAESAKPADAPAN